MRVDLSCEDETGTVRGKYFTIKLDNIFKVPTSQALGKSGDFVHMDIHKCLFLPTDINFI